jgi:hypothetical protein
MVANVTKAWSGDLGSPRGKHPLNPVYGGGETRTVESKHEIQTVKYYAPFREFENWFALMDDETIPPIITPARMRPIIGCRCHTAHVLIKSIAVKWNETQEIPSKTIIYSPSAEMIPETNSPI